MQRTNSCPEFHLVKKMKNNVELPVEINNFGKENLNHLEPAFLKKCYLDQEMGARQLLEMIFFSQQAPQNKNVRSINKSNSLVEIYENGNWCIEDKNFIITRMIKHVVHIFYEYDSICDDNEKSLVEIQDARKYLSALLNKQKEFNELKKVVNALLLRYSQTNKK